MQSKKIVVDGIKMRWEESGSGPTVVFVHGIPTSPQLWRHVTPLLPHARCLAWEMVGYGESMPECRVHRCSVARQAAYLHRWLDALEINRAVFVGHDLGGGVVQIFATQNPERCAGLVLTNSIGYDSWPIPSVRMMRRFGRLIEHLPKAAFHQVFRMFLARGHDQAGMAAESEAIYWPSYERHGGASAFVRQIQALDVRDTLSVADQLSSLRVPARVVWGAADGFQKIEYGERFSRDLAAPLRRIEGGAHFVPEDHPQEVARAVEEVLSEARGVSGGVEREELVGAGRQ